VCAGVCVCVRVCVCYANSSPPSPSLPLQVLFFKQGFLVGSMHVSVPRPPHVLLLRSMHAWCRSVFNTLYTRVYTYIRMLQGRRKDGKEMFSISMLKAVSIDLYEAAVWLFSDMTRVLLTQDISNANGSAQTVDMDDPHVPTPAPTRRPTFLPMSFSGGGFTPEIIATEYTRLSKMYPGRYLRIPLCVVYFLGGGYVLKRS
jgi:hypothetical protein